jgi:hypothetical protein
MNQHEIQMKFVMKGYWESRDYWNNRPLITLTHVQVGWQIRIQHPTGYHRVPVKYDLTTGEYTNGYNSYYDSFKTLDLAKSYISSVTLDNALAYARGEISINQLW